ncbi:hypothetical protein SAMN06265360_1255 [Haloechinothrix alba]|uniref:Uncharacterized protein n=1 Tax=Haloechinothrix alba TaxID=664784 RepID=A0A238ZSS3_9PSEU|nr:hypothetical protein SAMN06265360_1255 [Haloechinothrix alba]
MRLPFGPRITGHMRSTIRRGPVGAPVAGESIALVRVLDRLRGRAAGEHVAAAPVVAAGDVFKRNQRGRVGVTEVPLSVNERCP